MIYLFLAVTTGLLVWAGVKPWVDKGWERSGFGSETGRGGSSRSYAPVGTGGDGGSGGRRQTELQEEENEGSIPR